MKMRRWETRGPVLRLCTSRELTGLGLGNLPVSLRRIVMLPTSYDIRNPVG